MAHTFLVARPRFRPLLPHAILALLVLLLVFLGSLQNRWIGEVSRADKLRREAALRSSTIRFADDLDREVTRAFLLFQPEPGPPTAPNEIAISRLFEKWTRNAAYPSLVKGVFTSTRGEGSALVLKRFDADVPQLSPIAWPPEFVEIERRLRSATEGLDRGAGAMLFGGNSPAFALPLPPPARPPREPRPEFDPRRPPRRPGDDRPPPPPPRPEDEDEPGDAEGRARAGHLIVLFDREFLTRTLLPELFAKSFGEPASSEWVATVLSGRELASAVWSSDREAATRAGAEHAADLSTRVFTIRAFEDLRALVSEGERPLGAFAAAGSGPPWGRAGRPRLDGADGDGGRDLREGRFDVPPDLRRRGPPPRRRDGPPGPRFEAVWRLQVLHRDGTLEAAVARVKNRNMAVSLGVLALLGASLALLIGTTRRERRLARQQVEFVAGVSHEMHTPLAAIRSAAQNLSDGIVTSAEQVRRYGGVIESEGRRLSNLLGEALEMAGIQSGRKIYRRDSVEVEAIVEATLSDCATLLSDRRVKVDRDIPQGLPRVRGDAEALARALRNLVENAVKYGGEERWVGIRATARQGARTLAVSVTDRGPGIERADRPHVFTPFYRGRGGPEAGVPGSGLGLAIVKEIVEAHGGRVIVESGSNSKGSVFVMHLPTVGSGASGSEETAV